jgi:hypothetical protein
MAQDRLAGSEALKQRHPLAPTLADLKQEAHPPTSQGRPSELEKLETRLDGFAAVLGRSPDPVPVLDFKFHPGEFVRMFGSIETLLWPSGLFIPGTADYHLYWLFPPPAGKNRYTRQWIAGNGSQANHALTATGELFAYAAARPVDPFLRSEAGVGFVFTPTARLATYDVEVTVSLLGSDRYDVSTTAPAGGKVRKWGGLYTAAWEISPYDGSLSLVHPLGVVTLFNETFENLTGAPIQTFPLTGPKSTNIMMEGNKTYLISVIAAVEIQNDWVMDNGSPMQSLPDGSTWKMWCSIFGTIPQVWVTPSTIYIP